MTMSTNLEISPTKKRTFTYGTISCGADTYNGIWTKGKEVFSCDHRLRSKSPNHRTNFFRTSWEKYNQLDLLIIMDANTNKLHSEWRNVWGHPDRAKCLLVFHEDMALMASDGVDYRKWCKMMQGRGYDLRTWHVDATQCGAAIWSSYTVTFCFPSRSSHKAPNQLNLNIMEGTRSCRNVMRLYGILKHKYYNIDKATPYKHPIFHNVIGRFKGRLVYHWEGPACNNAITEWIYIPDKGIRRITIEEMTQLKGLTSKRYSDITFKTLATSVEQHV